MSIEAILDQLRHLDAAQLGELERRVKALRQFTPRPTTRPQDDRSGGSDDRMLVLGAIHEVLRKHGVDIATLAVLSRGRAVAAIRDKVPDLMNFVRAQVGAERGLQQALLALGIELLWADMTEMGLPVSATTLATQLHRFAAVLDRHFPGYAEGRMLKWIFVSGGGP